MKYCFILLMLISCLTMEGQTYLQKSMMRLNINISIPAHFEASDNDIPVSLDFVVEQQSQEDSITVQKRYPSLFGMVTSIIRHKSGEYVIFVFVPPGRGDDPHGNYKTDSCKIYTLNEILPFSRIKSDFHFGGALRSPSFADVYALDMMITHYPRERAKELFNAEAMIVYPFNLDGNVYEEKYDVCRAVVAECSGLSFFLYFMMTKDNFLNFDTYLNEMKGVFWFNDSPPPVKPEEPKRKKKVLSYTGSTYDLSSCMPPDWLNDYFSENFRYPKGKTAKGIVKVDFVISVTGKPEQFDLVKGLDKDFDDEVLRVLKKMPDWHPATNDGKPVDIQHSLTIKIDENKAWIRGMDESDL